MSEQRLHLVFGGRVRSPDGCDFIDTDDIHVVGIYPNYARALAAWRAAAQASVDDAQTRYFIAHLHRLFEPSAAPGHRETLAG